MKVNKNGARGTASSYGSIEANSATRDLSLARNAYGVRDANLSKLAHQQRAAEGHRTNGDFIKSIVYGGLDGVLTCFALISGAAGGSLGTEVILILGISNIVADAVSMGVGDTVSTLAYNDHVEQERRRECWEFDNYPEGEIEEMIDLYEQRGLPRDKAQVVVSTMAKYRDFFIDIMMCEELGLQVPDEDDNPVKEGFVTFVSFLIFGFMPLFGYIVFPFLIPDLSETALFVIACLVTMMVLFILGSFKSKFSAKSWLNSGMEFLLLGSAAAATSFFIGIIVKSLGNEWFEAHPHNN